MIYALCFDTNQLHTFRSEREAAEYCRRVGGEWQCCDQEGRAVYLPGLTGTNRLGLLAAHQCLNELHHADGYQEAPPWGYPPPAGSWGS